MGRRATARTGTMTHGEGVELTVVLPCLNEAASVAVCVAKARTSLDRLDVRGEVIVADNGSTDGSVALAEEAGARVVHVAERGYGAALSAGIAAARGDWVLMSDADDSYDLSAIGPFVDELRGGVDMVVGNRFAGRIEQGAMPFLHRYLGNPLLTRIARIAFRTRVGDIYCGIRAFRRDAVLRLDLRSTGMEFALEMVVKASLYGLQVAEVPTTLSPDRRDRAPHLRTWRDGWRSLRFFLLYSPSWLFLYPGLALMAIGTTVGLWLLPGARTVGGVGFDVHTLLYAALAVIVGFQAVVFSACAQLFALTEGLLPSSPKLERLFRFVTLEVGVAVGAALVVLGLAGSVYAVGSWQEQSFGRLDYADTMRIVIPSATVLVIGTQTILFSFFLSILGLRRRS